MKNIKYIVLLMAVSLSTLSAKAQNNLLVINGAYLVMNGGTQANNLHLVVNQPATQGILRMAPGGHIVSENQYNFITWSSGTTLGNYVFPFGVGSIAANYIPFSFNKTAGNSTLKVSTWATNQQNSPKPLLSNVAPVTNMLGVTDSVVRAIDRFWDIRATGTTADLTFSYRGSENTTGSPLSLVKAQHWNGSTWDTPVASVNNGVSTGVGSVGPIVGQSTFSPWVLIIDCPEIPIISSNTPICIGNTINLSANTVAGATYAWTGQNGFTSNLQNPSILGATLSMSGNYNLTVTVGGCTSPVATTSVLVNSGLNLTVTPQNPTIEMGASVSLSVSGATNYTWTPALGLSCTNCPSPIASPLNTTTYSVVGTDAFGCSGTANTTVFVNRPCGELFIPTIFSPNNDGVNDTQCVMGGCISTMNFSIFNRWGEMVFESNNPNICWDGNYKDKPANLGAYVYKFTATLIDGSTVQKSGNITLIR